MVAPTPHTESEYRIVINSIQLVAGTPITRPAVHNEVAFYHGTQLVAAFNGDPVNRRTGEFVFPSLSNTDTLQVTVGEGSRAQSPRNPYPLVASGVVFQGGREEFVQHLHQATAAAHSINNSNIDYIMVAPIMAPQNSNSVAGSLLQAMNLQPPETMQQLWAPGDGRTLLPDNFAATVPPLDPNNPQQLQELIQSLGSLNETAVRQRVTQAPNPYANGTQQECMVNNSYIECSHLQASGQLFAPSKPAVPELEPQHPSRKFATGVPVRP